jgi:hypothetical protein
MNRNFYVSWCFINVMFQLKFLSYFYSASCNADKKWPRLRLNALPNVMKTWTNPGYGKKNDYVIERKTRRRVFKKKIGNT